MIEFIFTLDYEIYGDGTGGLTELVYEPTSHLVEVFRRHALPFVAFVEVAELRAIETYDADEGIERVRDQICELHRSGCELGLHLHPQWCNAVFAGGEWQLDFSEYNLCLLPRARIEEIVRSGIDYLRGVLQEPLFTPTSFRAGNWLFQPTRVVADVLGRNGLELDSSLFKGARQHQYNLDYRAARNNDYSWRFSDDVNVPDPNGRLLEVPTYTIQVPFWKMLTRKRLNVHARKHASRVRAPQNLHRLLDVFRLKYPLKLDFCRLTYAEMVSTFKLIQAHEDATPNSYKPIVAIGHSKDLFDLGAVDAFLSYLRRQGIQVVTLRDVGARLAPTVAQTASGSSLQL